MVRGWILVLLLAASPAGAQGPVASPGPLQSPAPGPLQLDARYGGPSWPTPPSAPGVREALASPGGAFAASLVLPGAGQAAQGLRRWVVYGLVEAGLWGLHLDARADVRTLRGRYRDLAWEEARGASPEPRRDGDWDYYERMSQFLASGAYDADAAAGLQPEPDASTYNGSVWSLAVAIYLPSGVPDPTSPQYDRALDYYRSHAVGPAYLWSWIGKEEALGRFRSLIRETDDEARLESTALGLVLANHLVSAIDAFIAARGRPSDVRLQSRLIPVGPTLRWSVGLRVPLHD